MDNKVLKNSLPLILLGSIGMFLSEFLIWNIYSFTRLIHAKGMVYGAGMLIFGWFIYIILFAFFTAVIVRFRVNDFMGIVLAGSVYGLILEGVFADTIFDPLGLGPRICGIYLIKLNFTALSWHPLIDFYLSFLVLRLISKKKFHLSGKILGLGEAARIFLFCLFWFVWSYAAWLLRKFPYGIPVLVQALVLFCPLLALGLVLYFFLKYKAEAISSGILSPRVYPFLIGFVSIFTLLKFFSVADKASFIFFCLVAGFYVLLFFLYAAYGRKDTPACSIYEEAFPIQESFNPVKYLHIVFLAAASYLIFKFSAGLFFLGRVYTFLTVIFFFCFNIFAVTFPLAAIFKITLNIIRRRQK